MTPGGEYDSVGCFLENDQARERSDFCGDALFSEKYCVWYTFYLTNGMRMVYKIKESWEIG